MSENTDIDPREEIVRRVREIQLQMLDMIKSDLANGSMPMTELEAYETLCRAERTRLGL